MKKIPTKGSLELRIYAEAKRNHAHSYSLKQKCNTNINVENLGLDSDWPYKSDARKLIGQKLGRGEQGLERPGFVAG